MPPADVPLRDSTVIDLSHESLMRVWARLRDWVDDEAKSVGIFRRLSESAVLWRESRSGFYRDPELAIARAWVESSRPTALWAEQYSGNFEDAMAFLRASEDAAQEEVRAREAARQRELEQAQALAQAQRRRAEEQTQFAARLSWLVRGLGVVAVVALIAMGFAIVSRRAADENAVLARQAEAKAAASGVMVDQARGQAERLLSFLLDQEARAEIKATAPQWLAVALARQGRLADAARVIEHSDMQELQAIYERGGTLMVRRNLALGHYASALAQPDDAAGREKRGAALRQAKTLLDESTEEAKQLSEER